MLTSFAGELRGRTHCEFSNRVPRPPVLGDPLTLSANLEGDHLSLTARLGDGSDSMQADAVLSQPGHPKRVSRQVNAKVFDQELGAKPRLHFVTIFWIHFDYISFVSKDFAIRIACVCLQARELATKARYLKAVGAVILQVSKTYAAIIFLQIEKCPDEHAWSLIRAIGPQPDSPNFLKSGLHNFARTLRSPATFLPVSCVVLDMATGTQKAKG